MTSWCILQVAPSQTLQLAVALEDAGFVVWTPTETVRGDYARPREFEPPRRRRKMPEEITRPLLPSFVFADASRLAELITLAHSPSLAYSVWDSEERRMVTRGYPYFRVFQPTSRPIADHELDALRRIERRRKPRGSVKSFEVGERVKLTEGAYGGLRGQVVAVRSKGEVTIRLAGSAYDFTVQAWMLIVDLDEGEDIHHMASQAERV